MAGSGQGRHGRARGARLHVRKTRRPADEASESALARLYEAKYLILRHVLEIPAIGENGGGDGLGVLRRAHSGEAHMGDRLVAKMRDVDDLPKHGSALGRDKTLSHLDVVHIRSVKPTHTA